MAKSICGVESAHSRATYLDKHRNVDTHKYVGHMQHKGILPQWLMQNNVSTPQDWIKQTSIELLLVK